MEGLLRSEDRMQPRRVDSAIRDILANRRRLSPLADEIGGMIISGALKEGEPLSERMFGPNRAVSRTSFREAVKVLEGKGLIRARQNTGTLVAPRRNWHLLDPDLLAWRLGAGNIDGFIEDFFAFRQSIEPLAAESAARRRDEASIARIREALTAMHEFEARAPFGLEFVAADVRFHQAVFQASANEFLVAMGHILEVPLQLSFTLHSFLHVGPENRLALHAAVVDAIAAGNPAGAKSASAALLLDVADHVRTIVAAPEA
jgi:DNA-binding FadR family transcriptional regulator